MYFNKEIETMPLKKMRELQLERLKWAIGHAYKNNAFYQKKYRRRRVPPGPVQDRWTT